MSSYIIRPARPDDWPVIVDYNCRLAAETENLQLDRETVTHGVQALLADPTRGRYFLACTVSPAPGVLTPDDPEAENPKEATPVEPGSPREVIAGQLMHTTEWSDWRNGTIWWLQSVYVSDTYRRTGVFRALYEHLHREAVAREDVVGLRLYVEHENSSAQTTYASLGLQPAGYHVMEQLFTRPATAR